MEHARILQVIFLALFSIHGARSQVSAPAPSPSEDFPVGSPLDNTLAPVPSPDASEPEPPYTPASEPAASSPSATEFAPSPLSAAHGQKREEIGRVLRQFPEFSRFKKLLVKTQLSTKVNEFKEVTLLVVDNKALEEGGIGKDIDFTNLKRIFSVHILLGYYNEETLKSSKNESVHTLYSTTGKIQSKTGSLSISSSSDGILFKTQADSSASATSVVKLVKSVYQFPGNLSVVQVSSVLIPPNVDTKDPFPKSTTAVPKSVPTTSLVSAPAPAPFSAAPASPVSAFSVVMAFLATFSFAFLF